MKVIQIMPEFGLAGAEIMCENLVYELKKLGVDVSVISMYDYHSPITDRLEAAGIQIHYLGKKPGLDFSMIRKIAKILKLEKPDVIHTHRYVMQYAIPAAVIAGVKKRVHTVHNIATKESGRAARILAKRFYHHFHVIPVALSALVQQTISDEYSLPLNDIPVVFNGISLDRCLPKNNYALADQVHILHIGRFSAQKNHMEMLKAFAAVHQNHANVRLRLIGDGELKDDVADDIRQHDLENSVDFLGLQSNVYPFLHDADVFTLPSNYEGIPMTLIEAMGTGLPIVASAVGGVPDMIEDGKSGLLCEPNAESIAACLERMLADERLRESCGKAAKKRSVLFSAEQMAAEYLKIYNMKR